MKSALIHSLMTCRTVFALMIINKAGGLIFNRTFQEGGLNQLSSNDYLVIAGTFHGYGLILSERMGRLSLTVCARH